MSRSRCRKNRRHGLDAHAFEQAQSLQAEKLRRKQARTEATQPLARGKVRMGDACPELAALRDSLAKA